MKSSEESEGGEFPWLAKANGDFEWPQPADGKAFTLEELQAFVGGRIEIYPVRKGTGAPKGTQMVCNGEGKLLRLPPNTAASMMMGFLVVGDVLFAADDMV